MSAQLRASWLHDPEVPKSPAALELWPLAPALRIPLNHRAYASMSFARRCPATTGLVRHRKRNLLETLAHRRTGGAAKRQNSRQSQKPTSFSKVQFESANSLSIGFSSAPPHDNPCLSSSCGSHLRARLLLLRRAAIARNAKNVRRRFFLRRSCGKRSQMRRRGGRPIARIEVIYPRNPEAAWQSGDFRAE